MIAEDIFNSCLQIEQARVRRGLFLPRQIIFQFNEDVLTQLEVAKTKNARLTINSYHLAYLRFYALLNSGLSELESFKYCFKDQRHSSKSPLLPSSLTFATSYAVADMPINTQSTVVRSQIDLKGKIHQQVQQDLYDNAQLLPRIISVHHWLITQIVEQLPTGSQSDRPVAMLKLLWCIFWGLLSICLGFYLPIFLIGKILVAICCWLLSVKYLPNIVLPKLRSLVLIYLAHSLKGNKIKQSQLAWTLIVLFTK